MASISLSHSPGKHRLAFPIVAALVALLFAVGFGAAVSLIAPWTIVTIGPSDPHPELHRWHSVHSAATFGILFAGGLIALLRRSTARPIVAQFFVAGTTILAVAVASFDPAGLILIVIGALIAALYPKRRLLFRTPWPSLRRLDPRRLALAMASAAFLAPDAMESLRAQLNGTGGEHTTLNHWALSFALSILLVLAGLFSASNRPGGRTMAMITGLALLYLGAAAIAIPDHDGSWGVTGGMIAGLGGLAYLATAYKNGRYSGDTSDDDHAAKSTAGE